MKPSLIILIEFNLQLLKLKMKDNSQIFSIKDNQN
jgi:hypothetical protein